MILSQNKNIPLTIGILGGGQLAKMLSIEAYRLGLNVAIIEKGDNTPAGDMTKLNYTNGWFNTSDINEFIRISDIITLENEFIPITMLEYIETSKNIFPSSDTMKLVQDKYIQKMTFRNNSIAVPNFAEIKSLNALYNFAEIYGYPFIIKTRTLGYDGYGNMTINNENDCEIALNKFDGKSIMAEEFVRFEKEVAVIVARNISGEVAIYPCVETIQKNHICHKVIAPADVDASISNKAKDIAQKAVASINGIGVFGVEMFVTNDSKVLLNEIAPRPHNSGHYTIEGCYCSQYENGIRAILNLPLGSTEMKHKFACMINLLGENDGPGIPKDITNVLKFKHTKLHLYNKKQSRKGRKMGHITTIGDNYDEVLKEAEDCFNSIVW
ncbi:MAG: 5-(carboxyamino)imidazole ribonucleotide synthase [Bacteroidetes bacterium]|nr:5-(carboxyamino)imidazole ribonucleotide synthase [Bacteroidota bacterium]